MSPNPDLYIKSVEELMVNGKISVSYYPIVPDGENQWGQRKVKTGENWVATITKPRFLEGSGATPREAIIALYAKLSK